MWVVGSNIVIGLYSLDMWSVLCMWVVFSNIVIGLSVQDMWSMSFVMYVGDMFKYSDWTVAYWTCGQCCYVFYSDWMWTWWVSKWVLGSNIVIGLY